MRKRIVPILLIFILTACGEVSEEDLIGGEWVGTAGYENGEIQGEPTCYPMFDGISFVDGERAVVASHDREYNYSISIREEGFRLTFEEIEPETRASDSTYSVEMLSEDEMVWEGGFPSGFHCYMERKDRVN